MFNRLNLTIAAVLFCGSAIASEVGVRVECDAEPGFGYVRDRNGTGDQITLTEICFDREKGSFDGALSHHGFELVKDDGVSQTYEDLSVAGVSRPSLQVAPVITSTYHGGLVKDNSPEINVLVDGQFFVGFLYKELSGRAAISDGFGALVSVHPYGLQGVARFSDGTARIELVDSPMFGTSKNGFGTLELTVDDEGVVSGGGSFSAENIRTAGYQPNEWVSEKVEITELKGYSVGATGQVIKVFAKANATMTDAEGDVRSFPRIVEILMLDAALLNIPGN